MMKLMIYIMVFAVLLSCKHHQEASLEVTITSDNNDNINELNFFELLKVDTLVNFPNNARTFKNVVCKTPGKFIFRGLDTGCYWGLLQIQNNSGTYNINIDSIHISFGKNYLNRKLNLGSVKL